MVGRVLCHYRVLEKLGEGGMGEVYLAEDTTLKRQVALKVLPNAVASNRERLERLQREAESLAALSHPNIVTIYSIEAVDGTHFLTMELVEGESLGELIPGDGLPLQSFFDLAIPMADALAEAHEQGIVHRDLKPANIMVDAKGRPKILDFGLAKLRRTTPAGLASEAPTEVMTKPGLVMGTYPYMSPEQAEGREADHRSDLFSFGIVLYEMVTGERPFQGDSPASLISSILKDEPRPVFEVRSGLPEGLAKILTRCLEKRLADRYESAAELRDELEELRRIVESGVSYPVARAIALPGFLTEEGVEEAPPPVFVGRERELSRLDEFLDKALSGQTQVAFVTGEAGTGKTALVNAFKRRALDRREELVIAAGGCNAHTGAGDPYGPFRGLFMLLAGAAEAQWAAGSLSQTEALRLWDLIPVAAETICQQASDLIDIFIPGQVVLAYARAAAGDAPWLKSLADLVERKRALPPDPMLQQSALLAQCRTFLEILARERPLLLVLEDLHWSDSGSVNLLFELARGLTGSPACILGTYRPSEVALGRGEGRHPLETVLNELKSARGDVFVPLEQSGSRTFVNELVDSEPNQLSEAFRSTLFERTQGHALFTTELLHDMQERGVLVRNEAGEWVESPQLDWKALPARIEGAIGERIARLSGELRELLTLASVEGEDFTAEVLSRVRKADTRETVHRLSQELEKRHRLVSASGLKRVNATRLSLFRFRHVLFQRYLYNDLDEAERAYLHEDVGRVLEELYGEHTEEIAPQLARHFEIAGDAAKAVQFYRLAGARATRMGAPVEAISYFEKALALIAKGAESENRGRLEIDLQVSLCSALVQSRGWALPEVKAAVNRAEELARGLGDEPSLFAPLWFLTSYYGMRAEYAKAIELGPRMIELGGMAGGQLLAAVPDITLALYRMWSGDLEKGLSHAVNAKTVFESDMHLPLAFSIGLEPGVASLNWHSIILFAMGFADRAREGNRQMLSRADECDHVPTKCFAQEYSSLLFSWIEPEQALPFAVACEELSTKHGQLALNPVCLFVRAGVMALTGRLEDGFAVFERGKSLYEGAGNLAGLGGIRVLEALLHLMAGNLDEALKKVDMGLFFAREMGEGFFEPELLRAKAGVLASGDAAPNEVEECLLDAIARSRRMKARTWELRAATDLAGLWQAQGRSEEALELLKPVYDWFTEGFDIPDLRNAKALLEELGGS